MRPPRKPTFQISNNSSTFHSNNPFFPINSFQNNLLFLFRNSLKALEKQIPDFITSFSLVKCPAFVKIAMDFLQQASITPVPGTLIPNSHKNQFLEYLKSEGFEGLYQFVDAFLPKFIK